MNNLENVDLVLSGLGGQGILFMTKILARTALDKGFDVMGAETHGMAQRGGSVVSHLRLGKVRSSMVRTHSADFLLALEENEAYRSIPYLADGSRLFANASENHFPRDSVRSYLTDIHVVWRALPAGKLAMALGAPRSTNLALLGFFAAYEEGPFRSEDLRQTVADVSPAPFKDINLAVFDAGFQNGSQRKNGS